MDPELLKTIREYVKVSASAQKSGATVTPENQEEFFREKTGGKYGFKDADKIMQGLRGDHGNGVASFLQGFTSNFGDEIVGALPEALGGGEGGKEQMRLRKDLFAQDHPVGDAAIGVGGALASTVLLPELKMAKAATTGARIARGAGIGAAYGGAAGAGEGETIDERLSKGAFGAGAGAVLGAIPGAAVATYKTLAAPLERATARIEEAIQQMGGFHAARGELARLRASGKDHLALLADLSPHLNAAADFSANNSDKARVAIKGAVDDRAAGTPQRVLDDFRNAAGDAHAPTRTEDLTQSLRSWASDAYGKLRGMGEKFDTKAVAKELQHPQLGKAWQYIRRNGDLSTPEGASLDDFFTQLKSADPDVRAAARKAILNSDGTATAERPVSFGDLQQFKRILDARVSKAFKAGDGELGNAYKTIRDKVKGIITQKVPAYAATDAEYARRKGLIQAVQDGVDAFHNNDITALKNKVASLSPEALEQFRHGLASAQIVALQGKGTGSAAVREMTTDKLAQQARLKVVFGNEKTLNDFMEKAKTEKQFDQLKEAVGGSQTARRLAASAHDPLDEVSRNMHNGLISRVTHAATRRVVQAIQHKTAGEMAKPLLTQGGDAIERLLGELEKNRAPLVKRWVSDQLPAAIGSLLH